MKVLTKFLFTVFVAAALVVGLAVVAIKTFFPPEKIRGILEKQLTSTFHREVQLGGVSIGFHGLTVSNFKISDRPNFGAGTFLSSEQLIVRPRLWPLLHKQIVIREVALVKPFITVVREPSGQLNFSDLFAGTPRMPPVAAAIESPSSPTTAAGLPLTVGRALVKEGRLDFIDRSTAAWSAKLNNLNVKIEGIKPNTPARIEAGFDASVRGMNPVAGFNGTLDWPKQLDVKLLSIQVGASKIAVAGTASKLKALPIFDLTAQIDQLDIALAKKFTAFPKDLSVRGPTSGSITANGTPDQFKYSLSANLNDLDLAYGKSFSKPTGVRMLLASSGELLHRDELKMDHVKITVGDFAADGKAHVQRLTKGAPQFEANVKTNEFSITDLLKRFPGAALPSDVKITGPMQADVDASGTPDLIKLGFQVAVGKLKFHGTGDVNTAGKDMIYVFHINGDGLSLVDVAAAVPLIQEYSASGKASVSARIASGKSDISGKLKLMKAAVQYERSDITDLTGQIDFTTRKLSAPKLTGRLNGSPLTISMNCTGFDVHPVINSEITVGTLDLDKLMPEPTPTPGQKSHRSLFVETAWAAPPPAAASLPMDLKGTLKADVVQHPYLKAEKLTVSWNVTNVTPDLSKLSGSARLRQGKGQVRNIRKLISDSKAARIVLLPMSVIQQFDKATGGTLKLPSFDEVNFAQVTGDYTFKSGVMSIDKFQLDGTDLDAAMTGTAELSGHQKLSLKSTVKLAAGLVGGTVGDLLADKDGRVTLPMTIKGTMVDPKINVDAGSTGKQILESIERNPDHLKNVEDLLKGIFK